jgi:hypothetical protein
MHSSLRVGFCVGKISSHWKGLVSIALLLVHSDHCGAADGFTISSYRHSLADNALRLSETERRSTMMEEAKKYDEVAMSAFDSLHGRMKVLERMLQTFQLEVPHMYYSFATCISDTYKHACNSFDCVLMSIKGAIDFLAQWQKNVSKYTENSLDVSGSSVLYSVMSEFALFSSKIQEIYYYFCKTLEHFQALLTYFVHMSRNGEKTFDNWLYENNLNLIGEFYCRTYIEHNGEQYSWQSLIQHCRNTVDNVSIGLVGLMADLQCTNVSLNKLSTALSRSQRVEGFYELAELSTFHGAELVNYLEKASKKDFLCCISSLMSVMVAPFLNKFSDMAQGLSELVFSMSDILATTEILPSSNGTDDKQKKQKVSKFELVLFRIISEAYSSN